MASIRVLVTGAGSGVGQGIVKALRSSSLPIAVLSADISLLNSALFRADEAVLIPKVEAPGALAEIVSILKRHKIDVLMVGSEFELGFFSAHKAEIESLTKTLIVASPLEVVKIADDKWLTMQFLRDHRLPFAEAHLPTDLPDALKCAQSWGYPLILKTRTGTSNRHVHVINFESELVHNYSGVPKPMLQRMIARPSMQLQNEYTCSIFKCKTGKILGPFTARRTLRGGSSWAVEVAPFKDLYNLLNEIGKNLPTMGSLNIQLMVGEHGPVPFEFNARFSGTTAIRAHFGFNEPEMVLRNYFLGEELSPPVIRSGLAMRYLEEVFVENIGASELALPLPKGSVRPWF